jgi:hypothetical protein
MNKELAKTLTTALVQFIDRERSEGTMCCSNEECESLEYHIRNNHFDDVEAFIQKKLSKLTEFEQFMDGVVDDTIRETYSEDGFKDICKDALALAKKQLLSYADESNPAIEAMADLERTFECNPDKLPGWLKDGLNKAFKKGQESSHEDYIRGYTNGYKDAKKELFKQGEGTYYYSPNNDDLTYIDPMPMRMPYAMPEIHTLRPQCYEPGGTCTNPHFDCINCPKKTTGGIFTSPNTNTASGTSTLKAEG